MLKSSLLLLALAAVSTVSAHGHLNQVELLVHRRNHFDMHKRLDENCADKIRERKLKRNLAKRKEKLPPHLSERLYQEFLKKRDTNSSACILTPEVTQGPYHILGEPYRQSIAGGQPGITLSMEIDLVDVSTCEPLSLGWVESWHANATGYYSGYISETGAALSSGGGGMPGGSTGSGADEPSSGSMSGGMNGTMNGNTSTSSNDYSSATAGADSSGAASMLDIATTDEENFLRGAWRADEDGHLEIQSIIPGWYTGRAQHFHIKVYQSEDGYVATNGSFIGTSAVHTGQIFFDMATLNATAKVEPYASNAIAWEDAVKNSDDQWYPYQDSVGYTADAVTTFVNSSDITFGVVSSITVGLNLSYVSPEVSTQWYEPDSSSSA